MKETTLCYLEKNDAYLMLLRNKKKADLNQNKWIGVGGKLEENESAEACVIREVFEETGLTLNNPLYLGVVDFFDDDYFERMHLFKGLDFNGTLGDCNEGTLEWIKKNELNQLPMWEGDKFFIKELDSEDFFKMELYYVHGELKKVVKDGGVIYEV